MAEVAIPRDLFADILRRIALHRQGGFVTGLRSRRLPDKTACQLPDQTDNCLGGSFLHWCYAPSGRTGKSRLIEQPDVWKFGTPLISHPLLSK